MIKENFIFKNISNTYSKNELKRYYQSIISKYSKKKSIPLNFRIPFYIIMKILNKKKSLLTCKMPSHGPTYLRFVLFLSSSTKYGTHNMSEKFYRKIINKILWLYYY